MGLAAKQTTQIEQLKNDKIRDQEQIIQLQNKLIEKKDEEIKVVKDTVVSELKSYSSVVQENCSAALAPKKIVSAVKQVSHCRGDTRPARGSKLTLLSKRFGRTVDVSVER